MRKRQDNVGRRTLVARLWRERRGAAGVWFALTSFILIGVGAFSIDLGRLYSLHTDLQKVADGLAIAAARELDGMGIGSDAAIARSLRAIDLAQIDLVHNIQTYAPGGADVAAGCPSCLVRFFDVLPPDDCALTDPCVYDAEYFLYETNDLTPPADDALSARAHYVQVTVETRTIVNTLIRILRGPDSSSTAATAVAGVESFLCKSAIRRRKSKVQGRGSMRTSISENRFGPRREATREASGTPASSGSSTPWQAWVPMRFESSFARCSPTSPPVSRPR
jgi:hypothetical protein